jgi:hypothetical protein
MPMTRPLAGHQVAPQVAIVGAAVGLGHQHRHVATHHLAGGPAEHPLRRRIGALHDAALIDRDEPVDGRVDDRLQALGAVLALLLGMATRGHVALDHRKAVHFGPVAQHRHLAFDPVARAIGTAARELADARTGGSQFQFTLRLARGHGLRRMDLRKRPAEHLPGAIAGHAFSAGAPDGNNSVTV